MTAPYHTTGSGEKPPICFEEGRVANEKYGVAVRSGGPCPGCNFPSIDTLYFNPTDSYYYYHCPSCLKWFRYMYVDGTMSDMEVVKSSKRTALDIDTDVPNNW